MVWTQVTLRPFLLWILVFFLVVFYIFLLVTLYRWLIVKRDREHTIKLTNQGNLPSFYRLQVETTEPLLRFKFFCDGIPLAAVPESVPQEVEKKEVQIATLDHAPEKQPTAAKQAESKSKVGSPGASVDKATKKGQVAASKIGVVASFLGALGSLLPGSVGRKLSKQSSSARGAQTSTIKAVQAPKSMKRKTDAVKDTSGELSFSASTSRSAVGVHQALEAQQSVAPPLQAQESPSNEVVEHYSHHWAQTQDVAPGESILLNLLIGSQKKRYPQGSFVYVVHSQQIPLEEVKAEVPLVSKRGIVYFEPVKTWRYLLPFLTVLAIMLTTLLVFYSYFILGW